MTLNSVDDSFCEEILLGYVFQRVGFQGFRTGVRVEFGFLQGHPQKMLFQLMVVLQVTFVSTMPHLVERGLRNVNVPSLD